MYNQARSLVAALLASLCPAAPVQWNLSGVTFDDGGTATGFFRYDSDFADYTDIDITTTDGAAFGGARYRWGVFPGSPDGLGAAPRIVRDSTGEPLLLLLFTLPLDSSEKTIALGLFPAELLCDDRFCDSLTTLRSIVSGSVTRAAGVPEPATAGLAAGGVLLLCAASRRWRGRSLPAALGMAVFLLVPRDASAFMTCDTTMVPLSMRAGGQAELTGEIRLWCHGDPGLVHNVTFVITLGNQVTSNPTRPGEIETLLLIDQPYPAPAVNRSNGYTFAGQVRGTPGNAASGNVFPCARSGPASITCADVPVAGTADQFSPRILSFRNIRVAVPPGSGPVQAWITAIGGAPVVFNNAIGMIGVPGSAPAFGSSVERFHVSLWFQEGPAWPFRSRVKRAVDGSIVKWNDPYAFGDFFCSESGFSPDFATTAPGDIGSASNGTRFAATISDIPAGVLFLSVPNQLSGLAGTARRVSGFDGSFAGGIMATGQGIGMVGVPASRAVTLVYEVVSTSCDFRFAGPDRFSSALITPWPRGVVLTGAKVEQFVAPRGRVEVPDGPAPEPRFY
ncbi:MAG: hypothetical protein FJW40_27660 [Acidobacteria bacterium]|nr:hypothetical protein [Acidobacteriota bacterium]